MTLHSKNILKTRFHFYPFKGIMLLTIFLCIKNMFHILKNDHVIQYIVLFLNPRICIVFSLMTLIWRGFYSVIFVGIQYSKSFSLRWSWIVINWEKLSLTGLLLQTVCGMTGANGVNVVLNVVLVWQQGQGHVLTRQHLVENVSGKHMKTCCVTMAHVTVRFHWYLNTIVKSLIFKYDSDNIKIYETILNSTKWFRVQSVTFLDRLLL